MYEMLFTSNFVKEGTKLYFIVPPIDVICKYDVEMDNIETHILLNGSNNLAPNTYGGVIRCNNKLIIYPTTGDEFIECDFDLHEKKIIKCDSISSDITGFKFNVAFNWHNDIYFVSYASGIVVKHNHNTDTYQLVKDSIVAREYGMLSSASIHSDKILMQTLGSSVVALNMNTEKIQIFDWQRDDTRYCHICSDDKNVYQISMDGKIGVYNISNNNIYNFSILKDNEYDFNIVGAVCGEDKLYLIVSEGTKQMSCISIDRVTLEISSKMYIPNIDTCVLAQEYNNGIILIGSYKEKGYWYYLEPLKMILETHKFPFSNVQRKNVCMKLLENGLKNGKGSILYEGECTALDDYCDFLQKDGIAKEIEIREDATGKNVYSYFM